VIDSFVDNRRDGAYVGIRSDIAKYPVKDPLEAPFDATTELANIKTRLEKVPPRVQERLINWGYAAADAGLRAHIDNSVEPPADYPYPGGVIDQSRKP